MGPEKRSEITGGRVAESGLGDASSDAGKGKLLRLLESLEPLEEEFPEIDEDLPGLDDVLF